MASKPHPGTECKECKHFKYYDSAKGILGECTSPERIMSLTRVTTGTKEVEEWYTKKGKKRKDPKIITVAVEKIKEPKPSEIERRDCDGCKGYFLNNRL